MSLKGGKGKMVYKSSFIQQNEFSDESAETDSNYDGSNKETNSLMDFYDSDDDYTPSTGTMKRKSKSNTLVVKPSIRDRQPENVRQRQPTRKPDPKVFNRNALMARANRRRKKEYMESLEQEMVTYKCENRKLRKLLKQRDGRIEKLIYEKSYLRNVLANKTEIMSLIKTFNGNLLPVTSSDMILQQSKTEQPTTLHNNSPDSSISTYSNSDELFSDYYDDNDDKFSNDNLDAPYDNWERILNDMPGLRSIDDTNTNDDFYRLSSPSPLSSNVCSEHNYSNNNMIAQIDDDQLNGGTKINQPGICFHLSSGRVSLEFCATCHRNANDAWCEELDDL